MVAIELQKALETANETDKSNDLFIDKDLKSFTDLVKDKGDFDVLVKGFEDKKTINEIKKIKGLKDTIDTFVKTKGGLIDVFSKEYDPLAKDQDLYETCVLGAILTKDKVDKAEYKALAKEYYLTINPVKVEKAGEAKKEINTTFVSGSSTNQEIANKVNTEITMETGKNITEASVTVSAGADGDKMPLKNAKTQLEEKKAELTKLKSGFNTTNQGVIQGIIDELNDANIKTIIDKGTGKKDNEEQDGNRYLIASRLAGGLIEALKKFDITPEPTLTLKIDWTNCLIGKSQISTEKDKERSLKMNVAMTIIASTTPQTIDTPIIVTSQTTPGGTTIITGGTTNGTGGTTIVTGGANNNNGGNTGHGPNPGTGADIPGNGGIEHEKEKPGESPDIFISERIRIALSKDFKRNGKAINKDKDIQKIKKTDKENQFNLTIDNKDILFSCTKIDKDWNFEKDQDGNVKIKETDKKYYEMKLETTKVKDKFKVYDIKEEANKNITTTLNETKTKEEFKKYYTFKETGYSLDTNNITITKSATGDLESIKTNIKFTIPQTILDNQTDKTIKEDSIENITFDKNGEIKIGSGSTYEKSTGKNKFLLLTKDKDANDNYKKESKNINYNIKTAGKNITIINDEIKIDAKTKLADWGDNRIASEVENANKTQETFKNYTADLDANFKKRQINALGGDKYQLLVIPNIKGVDESQYVTMTFNYKQKPNTQTQYFVFDTKNITVPEKYKDKNEENKNYVVSDNFYYKISVPTGEQTSINPKIVLDYNKTKTEALKKTSTPSDNQINEAKTDKTDSNTGGTQDRNIKLLNSVKYNEQSYVDFNLDETEKTITYAREISLDEILGYDLKNKNKLVLGTIQFDGKGEIKAMEDRKLKVNKENQTLEIKDIFGRNKTLTIPFEIKNGKFTIGTNSNEKAKYIVQEFAAQKDYLKNRIYDEKSVVTTKLNEKIKEIGTQRASEFPGLQLAVPKEGKRNISNTPTIDAYQYLNGPTSTGLYYLKLNNGYKQGNDQRDEEFLYFKVTGKEVKLTDMNGNDVEETYVQSNKEYKPGKGLIKIKNDLTITTIKDVTEQEKGYPSFSNEPETVKNYLTKTVANEADSKNYNQETSGKYLRIFGNSKIGYITSIPIKEEENNKNKYLYNKEGLKATTPDDMAKDLRDYDNFKNLTTLSGLKESELKEIFMTKFKANKDIDKATNGDNIRIKNSNGKYEYWKISAKNEETIKFAENTISKEIQEKVIDDIKKDLAIVGSVENIKFKYRRNDEKRKILTPWDKAGNRTIKDLENKTIKDFINKETTADKKLTLQLLGPAKETIVLDINDKIYEKLSSKELENGYYNNLFENKLGDGSDKEITVQNETYKTHLKSDEESKENRIIFESQVEKAEK